MISKAKTIRDLQKLSHKTAKAKGWWDKKRTPPELLMLVVSELSEALEVWRDPQKSITATYIELGTGKPEGFGTELADAVIRIADLAESQGIDLQDAIEVKMAYNSRRSYRHGNKRG